jgi:hypothetical protein
MDSKQAGKVDRVNAENGSDPRTSNLWPEVGSGLYTWEVRGPAGFAERLPAWLSAEPRSRQSLALSRGNFTQN